MNSYISHSLEETGNIARNILANVANSADTPRVRNNPAATIIGLSGHLGAGKTAFVKAVARILGVAEEVTSPTFVIMKIYPLVGTQWKQLIHIDAYRLEKGTELAALKFAALAQDPSNLIFVEWPEHVRDELVQIGPYATITFSLVSGDEHKRSIAYAAVPS